MSQEIQTTLRFDGRILDGKLMLEPDGVLFQGDVTLRFAFSEIFKVESNGGFLDLQTGRGLLMFELGAKADTWAAKIRNPRALIEKLGLKADQSVVLMGKVDAGLRAEIEASGAKVSKAAPGKVFDGVFLAVNQKEELDAFAAARESMRDDGCLWVVFPGAKADLRERDILIAGRSLGLSDQKPIKLDDGLLVTKFVVFGAARKKK